jgi:tRNA (guanosine-2'-O-)-methyltransferase
MTRCMKHETHHLTPQAAARYVDAWPADRVCEALRPHLLERRAERIDAVLAARLASVTVAVENLHDPRNGAAAVRTAEAIGLTDFHAIEGIEPFEVERKVSMSGHLWMDVHRYPTVEAGYAALRGAGFRIFAAGPRGRRTLAEVPVDRPLALVFGNEHGGLTDGALDAADDHFVIPMWGFTESFNLSVSAALATYDVVARRRAHLGCTGDLPPERIARLRAIWYCLSVRAAGLILRRAGWHAPTLGSEP